MSLDIEFAPNVVVYDPSLDSWTDDLREWAHEQLAMPRLNRWELTAKALEEMNAYD